MKIFYKRPLFTACVLAMLVTVLSVFFGVVYKLVLMTLSLPFAVIFILLYRKRRVSVDTAACAILCSFLIFVSSISSFTYFDLKYPKYANTDVETVRMQGIVLSGGYSMGVSQYKIYVTATEELGGGFYAILECDYPSFLSVGDEFTGLLEIGEFEESTGAYSEKHMRLSDSIFLRLLSDDQSQINIIAHDSRHPIAALPRLNSKLCDILQRGLSSEAGGIAKALFLGNKDDIPATVTRDFRYAGASHVLAISGMHMSILFGALAFFLKKLAVSYRARAVILTVLAASYLALTGFSASATRSVIMLIAVYVSMLASHNSDSLTTLSAAGAIMLIFSPNTVFDAGFWMSFAATLGILAIVPHVSQFLFDKLQPSWERFGFILSPIVSLITAIVAGIGAIMPLVVVLCIFVRQISIFSVISSIALMLPTQIILILSPLALIFSRVRPIAALLYFCIEKCCDFMMRFTSGLSQTKGTLISLESPYTTLLAVLLGAGLLLSLALRFKHKLLAVIPYGSALIIFTLCIAITSSVNAKKLNITYICPSEQSNFIVASANREAAIFDMSNGSMTAFTQAIDEVERMGIVKVKSIIVADLTTLHLSTLSRICRSNFVDSIYVPTPKEAQDYFRIISLKDILDECKVTLNFYSQSDSFEILQNTNITIDMAYISRSTLPNVMLTLERGEETLTYISPSYVESDIASKVFEGLPKTEHLIIGSSGPSVKEDIKIYNGHSIKQMIISSQKVLAAYVTHSIVNPDAEYVLFPRIYRFTFEN